MTHYIAAYIAYLKDNPNRYWFKRKLYGWGWTPATKEGWFVVIVWLFLFLANMKYIDRPFFITDNDFTPRMGILVFLLLIVCYTKGEKPRWQWGVPEKGAQKP